MVDLIQAVMAPTLNISISTTLILVISVDGPRSLRSSHHDVDVVNCLWCSVDVPNFRACHHLSGADSMVPSMTPSSHRRSGYRPVVPGLRRSQVDIGTLISMVGSSI